MSHALRAGLTVNAHLTSHKKMSELLISVAGRQVVHHVPGIEPSCACFMFVQERMQQPLSFFK